MFDNLLGDHVCVGVRELFYYNNNLSCFSSGWQSDTTNSFPENPANASSEATSSKVSFTAVAALLLARAVLARRFLNAYHGITELRRMNPFEFEHYVANLFRRLGYAARVTAASGDYGVDIVVKKGGRAAAVQCKRYAEHKYVDSPDIQRFIGSMEIYRLARGFFVATTRASPPAAKLAAAHGIEIIDAEKLIRLV